MKKLMWIQGFLPEKLNKMITEQCDKNNKELKLSERFLIYPMHISLKRTFVYADFEKTKETIRQVLERHHKFRCCRMRPYRIEKMLWLLFDYDEELIEIHKDLDETLYAYQQIIIDEYDRRYLPHITLFHDEDTQKLDLMAAKLSQELSAECFTIEKIAIGSKEKDNEIIILN
ncbi:MAG: 2'-5' RNA ligase family protein [Erysipelotrichaceae bacterium]|nr:2'-5' RNA ligase family protein [Erysipelotrichaceae bacterium]